MFDIRNYTEIIDSFYGELVQLDKGVSGIKLSEDKWSPKEIIGHLIDSASNNHQRFVRLQEGDLLGFPAYTAEEWLSRQKYNEMDWDVIISLWYSFNKLIINIVKNLNEACLENVWIKDEEALTLEYLVNSYYEHMTLHVNHLHERVKEIQ